MHRSFSVIICIKCANLVIASYPVSILQRNIDLSSQPHVFLLSFHVPDFCFLETIVFFKNTQLVYMESPHVVLERQTVGPCLLKVRQSNTERMKTTISWENYTVFFKRIPQEDNKEFSLNGKTQLSTFSNQRRHRNIYT